MRAVNSRFNLRKNAVNNNYIYRILHSTRGKVHLSIPQLANIYLAV